MEIQFFAKENINLLAMRKTILLSLIVFAFINVKSQEAAPDISINIESLDALKTASLAYQVVDSATGKVIAEHNPDVVLAPASVLKLFSTAVALNILGEDKRPTTKVLFSGSVSGGVLNGDIIVDPNFNPVLANERFQNSVTTLVQQIKVLLSSKGVKKVSGGVKVYEPIDYAAQVPRTWIWEDIGNYYGAGAGRTILNENKMELHFKSTNAGTLTELVSVEPKIEWLTINNKVMASKKRKDLAYAFGSPSSEEITVLGTIPQRRRDFEIRAALPKPAKVLSTQLKKGLTNMGVKFKGNAEVISVLPEGAKVMKEYGAIPLKKIIKATNTNSVNVLAEALLSLAHQESGSELPKMEWFKEELKKNVKMDGAVLQDACGLSRFNAVSVSQVNQLLKWITTSKHTRAYTRSLAVGGGAGTLKRFLYEGETIGKFKGKSGSMTGVKAYGGKLKTKSGNAVYVTIIVNNADMANGPLQVILEGWFRKVYAQN